MTKHNTREEWLKAAIQKMDKIFFSGKGYSLPEKLGVSCGFPKAGGSKAIGQCWDPSVTKDGTTHIFICPTQEDPMRVLDILLHELIHASVGLEAKHGGAFKKLAREFGLAGKLTATICEEGSELHNTLNTMLGELGDYPHTAILPKKKPSKPNRWVRFVSTSDEKYKVIVNLDRVLESGLPVDPWGYKMQPLKDEVLEELKLNRMIK